MQMAAAGKEQSSKRATDGSLIAAQELKPALGEEQDRPFFFFSVISFVCVFFFCLPHLASISSIIFPLQAHRGKTLNRGIERTIINDYEEKMNSMLRLR